MLLYYVTLGFFVIFLLSYLQDRRKIINGFLLNIVLFLSCGSLAYVAFDTKNPILMGIVIVLLGIFIFFLLFGAFILMVAAFLNARILIRKEGRRFANFLTLFVGLGILTVLIYSFFNLNSHLPVAVQAIINFTYVVIVYFALIFVNFLAASLMYQLYRPRLNKDYVIVLGSGLIDGHKVPPLLGSRIDKAIAFYHQQQEKRTPPKLIFSGGKGSDEQLAEAVAMQQYALEKGIPIEDTLIEDHSVNTLQNMLFSKVIMNQLSPNKYRAIFSTNNFHLFRAGIYAKRAGLNAQGIGAKTAFYYWPNAMIREFVATVVMHKKLHLIFVSLMALTAIGLYIISHYYVG